MWLKNQDVRLEEVRRPLVRAGMAECSVGYVKASSRQKKIRDTALINKTKSTGSIDAMSAACPLQKFFGDARNYFGV